MAVAGFGYEHLLAAIADLLRQSVSGASEVHNLYPGVVTRGGNAEALALIGEVFTRVSSVWRGLGEIVAYGMRSAVARAKQGRRWGNVQALAGSRSFRLRLLREGCGALPHAPSKGFAL
jgi:hydrogenase expression/formation protein HypD